jgi:hypothetical protein
MSILEPWRDATENDPTVTMFRITFFAILLLTGCENQQVKMPVGQIQQIESPLQNTVEGTAKAKAPDLERSRLTRYRSEHPSLFR